MSFSGLPWGRKFYPHTHTHGDSHTHGRHGYFNVRSKDDISQLNLPHGSTTKKYKTEKVKSKKMDMLRSNSKQAGESRVSPEEERKATVGRICRKVRY